MKTPDERYISDPGYRSFVDSIETLLEQEDFTPSEIKEMSMQARTQYEAFILACALYEAHHRS